MKTCAKCKMSKPYSCFNKAVPRKDGHYPYCKDCCKEYRERNKEVLSERRAAYYARPEIRERSVRYHREQYASNRGLRRQQRIEYYSDKENRTKLLINRARYRSRAEGIPFNLELGDVLIPEKCPYLGIHLTFELGNGRIDSNPSIDKIDPSKGYIKGNVQVISELANRMKNSATKEQLLTFAYNVIEKHREAQND